MNIILIIAYADDVAIILEGKYPQTICDLCMEIGLKCGLGVNPAKTIYNKTYDSQPGATKVEWYRIRI